MVKLTVLLFHFCWQLDGGVKQNAGQMRLIWSVLQHLLMFFLCKHGF